MKKSVFTFVAIVILVMIAVVVNEVGNSGVQTAGGGLSLRQANDTTKTSMVSFVQVNTTTDGENLAQAMAIGSYEHMYSNGIFAGGDFVGTVSNQFGIMAATMDIRGGLDFNTFRLECKIGNFTRNSVTTAGFDPQFANNCIIWGESAAVSSAVQMSIISKDTKVYVGHEGGEKFYSFCDGNYYIGAEQRIKNVSLSGGVNFMEQTTGFAAAKWSCKNNTLTATANKLGSSENQNFVLSYLRNRISLGKGVNLSVGSALYFQPTKSGLQLVACLNKGKFTLFTQGGGYKESGIFTPLGGIGLNYNL